MNSKDNGVTSKDFQLQITNCFNTPINKHWAILFQDLIFPSFIILLEQFSPKGVASGCVLYLFELQRQWKNVQNIQALWYTKCSIIGLSTTPSLINFQYNVTTLKACTKMETEIVKIIQSNIYWVEVFFSLLWCNYTGNHSQEDLARFGYKTIG